MAYRFHDYWIAETLRLRESLWGPLEDSSEAGQARIGSGPFSSRVLERARLLATREGLDKILAHWRQAATLMLWAFAAAAIVTGAIAASATLGGGDRPVNLAMAVSGLLGLNLLTLFLWIVSFGLRAGESSSLLADLWLRLTKSLARGPDAALAPRALLEIIARQKASRWSAGIMSHGWWALALLSAVVMLVLLLALRRYQFQWETTLLSPDTYVAIVQSLGWLPSLLGFAQPGPDIVRMSDGQHVLPEAVHALWSSWLLGVITVYGLLPRIALLALSWIMVRKRMRNLSIDPSLPGIAELHERLMPTSINTGIDALAPAILPAHAAGPARVAEAGATCILGIEIPDDLEWPPFAVPGHVHNIGIIESREDRRTALEMLRRHPPERLLVYCDGRQTPDRGTLALLAEFRGLSAAVCVGVVPEHDGATRRMQWQQALLNAGFDAEALCFAPGSGAEWINTTAPSAHADAAPVRPGGAT